MLLTSFKPFTLGIAVGLALVSGSAMAQYAAPKKDGAGGRVIIKSLDARGHVMYSDHPVEGAKELQTMQGRVFMNIPGGAASAPVAAASSPAKAASGAGGIEAWAVATQTQMDANKKAVDDMNAKVAKQNCDAARQTLATLSVGRRIVKVNASGEPAVMTGDQVTSEREKTEAQIVQNCK